MNRSHREDRRLINKFLMMVAYQSYSTQLGLQTKQDLGLIVQTLMLYSKATLISTILIFFFLVINVLGFLVFQ